MPQVYTSSRNAIGRRATGRSAAARFSDSLYCVAALSYLYVYAVNSAKYRLVDLPTLVAVSDIVASLRFHFFISFANSAPRISCS